MELKITVTRVKRETLYNYRSVYLKKWNLGDFQLFLIDTVDRKAGADREGVKQAGPLVGLKLRLATLSCKACGRPLNALS